MDELEFAEDKSEFGRTPWSKCLFVKKDFGVFFSSPLTRTNRTSRILVTEQLLVMVTDIE